ncbi:hypothetical protein VPH35_028663 [Triticum aestivum]
MDAQSSSSPWRFERRHGTSTGQIRRLPPRIRAPSTSSTRSGAPPTSPPCPAGRWPPPAPSRLSARRRAPYASQSHLLLTRGFFAVHGSRSSSGPIYASVTSWEAEDGMVCCAREEWARVRGLEGGVGGLADGDGEGGCLQDQGWAGRN